MGVRAGSDVSFDFDGSLELARQLWRLADRADHLARRREGWARDALGTWTGRFATEFAGRVNGELADLTGFAADLRHAAKGWAWCWSEAMNEQNDILWAREYQRREERRNLLQKLGDVVFGKHISMPARPPDVSPPVAPRFAATGSLARY